MESHQPETKQERTSWKCPLCEDVVLVSRGKYHWRQQKQQHIEAWHPEERHKLRCWAPRRADVQSLVGVVDDEITWRCPLCDQGLVGVAPASSAGKYARFEHQKEAHPRAKTTKFKLVGRTNYKQANIAVRNATAAKRGLDIITGEAGIHEPEQFLMPVGTRKGRYHAACRRCGVTAQGIN